MMIFVFKILYLRLGNKNKKNTIKQESSYSCCIVITPQSNITQQIHIIIKYTV